jgi:hypothetical protein
MQDISHQTMTYDTLRPPFTLNLREMPESELKRYFQWFLKVLPEREKELAETVRETPGFEAWRPDCTPDSLDTLGGWFAGQVETRNRTPEEIQRMQGGQTFSFAIANEELTERTFSLAMDIGMYFSQVMLKNHPSLEWEQPLGSKRNVDYGQPSLSGFGVVTLNPVGIAVTLTYGLAEKKKTGKRLREVYEYWTKQVRGRS